MHVIWTTPAREEVNAIFLYLVARNPTAANAIATAILKGVKTLAEFPYLGRPGRVEGTRELVIPRQSYLVIYAIEAGEVVIYHVVHGAQSWPPIDDNIDDEGEED